MKRKESAPYSSPSNGGGATSYSIPAWKRGNRNSGDNGSTGSSSSSRYGYDNHYGHGGDYRSYDAGRRGGSYSYSSSFYGNAGNGARGSYGNGGWPKVPTPSVGGYELTDLGDGRTATTTDEDEYGDNNNNNTQHDGGRGEYDDGGVLPALVDEDGTFSARSTLEGPSIDTIQEYMLKTYQFTLDTEQVAVLKAVQTGANVLIMGNAGTGKSALIAAIQYWFEAPGHKELIITCATTGMAAVNIRGETVHAWCQMSRSLTDNTQSIEEMQQTLMRRPNKGAKLAFAHVEHLIIDEISMLRCDVFDKLEAAARVYRNSTEPFGGIQLILSGDFLQLAPVVKHGEPIKEIHPEPYAFLSDSWSGCIQMKNIFELTQCHRQGDDLKFVKALGEVRTLRPNPVDGKRYMKPSTLRLFQEMTKRSFVDETRSGIVPTKLYSRNDESERHNQECLRALRTEEWRYNADDVWYDLAMKRATANSGRSPLDDLRAVSELRLKLGAQVMLIKNLDVKTGLCNGSRGIVIGFRNQPGMQWEDLDPITGHLKTALLVEDNAKTEVAALAATTPSPHATEVGSAAKTSTTTHVRANWHTLLDISRTGVMFGAPPEGVAAATAVPRYGTRTSSLITTPSSSPSTAMAKNTTSTLSIDDIVGMADGSVVVSAGDVLCDTTVPSSAAAMVATAEKKVAMQQQRPPPGHRHHPIVPADRNGTKQGNWPVILFKNGVVAMLKPIDFELRQGQRKKAVRTQVPLMLAWSITMHKSQGQTCDLVETSIDGGVFSPGQAYVALSRTRRSQDLFLREFNPNVIVSSEVVHAFMNKIRSYRESQKPSPMTSTTTSSSPIAIAIATPCLASATTSTTASISSTSTTTTSSSIQATTSLVTLVSATPGSASPAPPVTTSPSQKATPLSIGSGDGRSSCSGVVPSMPSSTIAT